MTNNNKSLKEEIQEYYDLPNNKKVKPLLDLVAKIAIELFMERAREKTLQVYPRYLAEHAQEDSYLFAVVELEVLESIAKEVLE